MGDCGHLRRRLSPGVLLAVSLLVALLLGAASSSSAAVGVTYTVDTTDGTRDGICGGASDCSFADAIAAANANPGKDTIAFAIPGSGPHTIVHPSTGGNLFDITDAVVIDARTQPGYTGTPLIEIDANGRTLLFERDESADSELRGIAFFEGVVEFNNPGRNVVDHNFLGTDATASVRRGGGDLSFRYLGQGDGFFSVGNMISDNVLVGSVGLGFGESSDNDVLRNMIGTDPAGKVALAPTGSGSGIGVLVGHRNVFSANVIAGYSTGISFVSATSVNSDNLIEGNFVGTDIDGELPLGNAGPGISLGGRGTNNIVIGNVISANGTGVTAAAFQDGTVVRGNKIGTDIDGEADLGNRGDGVAFFTGSGVLIADNVISGNAGDGISVGSSLPLSVRIEGNRIGTNASATAALPNDGDGVKTNSSGSPALEAVIGGQDPAQRNVISGNGASGVVVGPFLAEGVDLLNNYIGTNGDGTADLGNVRNGVELFGADATVGRPGAGNVISGNGLAGIDVHSRRASIQANTIGANALGDGDLGNDGSGIALAQATDTQIGGSTDLEGNLISGNGRWGIERGLFANGVVIERNKIGTNLDGTTSIANDLGGIVGGGGAASGEEGQIVNNLVSGNGGDGIRLVTPANRVRGNLIGIAADGHTPRANTGHGIHVTGGAHGNVVGGMTVAERNVISGNEGSGVVVVNAERNHIVGNYIGTDATGMERRPNQSSGISLEGGGAQENTVEHNVVSANGGHGITIVNASTQRIRANLVGTAADGLTRLGNGGHGISLEGSSDNVARNVIGGPEPADGNTVAFNGGHGVVVRHLHLNVVERNRVHTNGGDGVAVVSPGALGNKVSRNGITANAGLGIDLEDDGVTRNDARDGDFGANRLQNTPVDVRVSADRRTITGTLSSAPNQTYTVEIFRNRAADCDPSGNGEGEAFLAATATTTDGTGHGTFSVSLPEPLAGGDVVTATATDAEGNTSEFSQCTPQGTIVVQKVCQPAGDPGSFNLQVNGSTLGTAASCGQSRSATLSPGDYTVSETGAAGTNLADYETAMGGACAANGSVSLAAGESKTCTVTNSRKPVLTVTKQCPNGKQSPEDRFEVVLDGSRTERILDCTNSTTFVVGIGTPVAITEAVPTGNTTTNLNNYTTTYSTDCNSTGFAAGATPTCTITNTRRTPIAQVFTPGYWKNHRTETEALLPIRLGNYLVASFPEVSAIFTGMNCRRAQDQDAVGCLAGHLLAGKLNVKNGASNCINARIAEADALLISLGYSGPNQTYTLTAQQRAQLLAVKDTLDKYNNVGGC